MLWLVRHLLRNRLSCDAIFGIGSGPTQVRLLQPLGFVQHARRVVDENGLSVNQHDSSVCYL